MVLGGCSAGSRIPTRKLIQPAVSLRQGYSTYEQKAVERFLHSQRLIVRVVSCHPTLRFGVGASTIPAEGQGVHFSLARNLCPRWSLRQSFSVSIFMSCQGDIKLVQKACERYEIMGAKINRNISSGLR